MIKSDSFMKPITNTPLALAFIIVVILFLLFCGGAITMMMMKNGMNNNGALNNISWMWIPALVSLLLSGLIGWELFRKKDQGN